MLIDLLSLFPKYFDSALESSILGRAQSEKLIAIRSHNIRDFSTNKHHKVDDRPYGGGPGMVMMVEPIVAAIRAFRTPQSHVIFLSPQGKTLQASDCKRLSGKEHLIILCGHYEGIDERALKEVDEELSIGNYVLTSGCPAATVLIDAVSRFIPGVIGNAEGPYQDSFEKPSLFEGPQYTRPEIFEGESVPEVLRCGNHSKIAQWREEKGRSKAKTIHPHLFSLPPIIP